MRRLTFVAMVLALTGCLNFEDAGEAFCLNNPRCADAGMDSGTPGQDDGGQGDGGLADGGLADGGQGDSGTLFPDASYPNHSSWDDFGGSIGADVRGISARSNGGVTLFGNVQGTPISFDPIASVSDDYGFVYSVDSDGAPADSGTLVIPGLDGGSPPVSVTAMRETTASELLAAINTIYGRTLCFSNEVPQGTSVQKVSFGTPSSCTTVLSMNVASAEVTGVEALASDTELVAYAGWYRNPVGFGQVTLTGHASKTLPQTESDGGQAFFAVRTWDATDPVFVHPPTEFAISECDSAFTDLRFLGSDQLLVAGYYSGSCDFGNDVFGSPLKVDAGVPMAFAARFNVNLKAIVFLKTLGETDLSPVRVAVPTSGRMVVGYTRDADVQLVDFDTTSGNDPLALALTNSATSEKLTGLAAAEDGSVWVTGTFSHDVPNTPVEFGPGAVLLTGEGQPEGFVLKCKLGAPCSRAYGYRSDGAVEPTGITVIGSDVHVTGNFRGAFSGGDEVSLQTNDLSHQQGFHVIFADPDVP